MIYVELIKQYFAQVNTQERLNIIIDFLPLLMYLISLDLIWNNVGWKWSTFQKLALIIKLLPYFQIWALRDASSIYRQDMLNLNLPQVSGTKLRK